MRLLDLFCGAGGAAMGYHRAGFDEIVGVDIVERRKYPFEFIKADAIIVLADWWTFVKSFDMIHASPPCQAYSVTRHSHKKEYPQLISPVRDMLRHWGVPYVIENVPGSPLIDPVVLCGASFGLTAYDEKTQQQLWLKRHRLFETSFPVAPVACDCKGKKIGGVYGGGPSNRSGNWKRGGYTPPMSVRKELMGIQWCSGKSLNEAIPPAYTEYIGREFLEQQVAA